MLTVGSHPVVPASATSPLEVPAPSITPSPTIAAPTIAFPHLAQHFQSGQDLGRWVRAYVERHGMVLLKGWQPRSEQGKGESHAERNLERNLDSIMADFGEFCRSIGTLVPHNPGQDDFVWPIRPVISRSALKTFSEHNQAAHLHTDSQYRPQPEHFVAMCMVQTAQCGGGVSELLDFRRVIEDLEQTAGGQALLQVLRTHKLPIGVPSIFREPGDSGYIEATILGGAVPFRYRYDTMKAGLDQVDPSQRAELGAALDRLDAVIQASPHRLEFPLENQDVLLVDNHRFLHGRKAFTDRDRLLLRVRFD